MDHQVGILHGRNTDLAGLLGSKGGSERLGAMLPPLAGRKVGAGWGQKPHRAQVSSLGQKGQEKRRAMGKGEGWRKDGVLRLRASDRRLVCSWQECPHSALSNGLGAGHGLSRFSDVAGILTREV